MLGRRPSADRPQNETVGSAGYRKFIDPECISLVPRLAIDIGFTEELYFLYIARHGFRTLDRRSSGLVGMVRSGYDYGKVSEVSFM